jgi:hypothetical protein
MMRPKTNVVESASSSDRTKEYEAGLELYNRTTFHGDMTEQNGGDQQYILLSGENLV